MLSNPEFCVATVIQGIANHSEQSNWAHGVLHLYSWLEDSLPFLTIDMQALVFKESSWHGTSRYSFTLGLVHLRIRMRQIQDA